MTDNVTDTRGPLRRLMDALGDTRELPEIPVVQPVDVMPVVPRPPGPHPDLDDGDGND